MPFKIMNGTPNSGKSLCESCANCRTVKGQNCEEVRTCSAMMFGNSLVLRGMARDIQWTQCVPNQIPYKVAECSSYRDVNTASLDSMEKIAWEIVARKRGAAGFGQGATNPDELEMVITPPKTQETKDAV